MGKNRSLLPLIGATLLLPLLFTAVFGCGRKDAVRPAARSEKMSVADADGVSSGNGNAKTDSSSLMRTSLLFQEDYRTARQAARDQGKPLLLFFYAPNCTFSTQMFSETFQDKGICRASERFICVRIDSSVETELCKEFNVKGFPTIQFMSPQGVMLKRLTGKQNAVQLAAQMDAAVQSIARKTGTPIRK